MIKKILCAFCILISFLPVAQGSLPAASSCEINLSDALLLPGMPSLANLSDSAAVVKRDKATAIFMAVTVGILGVHRFYLGTSVPTMVAYVITLGGFGIVTVIDVIQLIIAKDISPFIDNPDFFMWNFEKSNKK